MTPDQHDCAANYQKLEDGASYEFEAGFKIKLKKKEFIFVNMHCPLPQFEGTTFPAIQEGGTTTFSCNPGNFPFSKNSQTGYLECEIARVERNSATQSAEIANCRRKRMTYLRKKRSLEEKDSTLTEYHYNLITAGVYLVFVFTTIGIFFNYKNDVKKSSIISISEIAQKLFFVYQFSI